MTASLGVEVYLGASYKHRRAYENGPGLLFHDLRFGTSLQTVWAFRSPVQSSSVSKTLRGATREPFFHGHLLRH